MVLKSLIDKAYLKLWGFTAREKLDTSMKQLGKSLPRSYSKHCQSLEDADFRAISANGSQCSPVSADDFRSFIE